MGDRVTGGYGGISTGMGAIGDEVTGWGAMGDRVTGGYGGIATGMGAIGD